MSFRVDDVTLGQPHTAPFTIPIAPKASPYDKPKPKMPDEEDVLGRKAYIDNVYGGLVSGRPEVQKAVTDQYEYNKKRVLAGKSL